MSPFLSNAYRHLLRPILFRGIRADPEWLHDHVLNLLEALARNQLTAPPSGLAGWSRSRLAALCQSCQVSDGRLHQTLWGLNFPNPLGLAAGFDKNGQAAPAWPLLGFGYAELGTVTYRAQPGNSRPRLFRLPQDRAAINRMGFNNDGAAQLAARLQAQRAIAPSPIPLGINLGKSKATPLDQAVDDYVGSFRQLRSLGDYFVVNVSSPNTPGLRSLQAHDQLAPILAALQAENTDHKPLLVKIAPDLDWAAIAAIADLAETHALAGIIATNTTLQRRGLRTQRILTTGNTVAEEPGGLSGAPLRQRSTEVIRFLYQHSQGRLPIIGVGGIFTAADAWEKLAAGASLLQTYTGWIYEGPWMVRQVLAGLLAQLEARGYSHLSAAIGCEAAAPPTNAAAIAPSP